MALKNTNDVTILVVDDNPINLELLSDCLTEFGYTVLLKKDGEKALALLERRIPDIILLDILMPGIDGFETCKYIKSMDRAKDIPVIFMTALTDTSDKIKGFELGAVDYITKPFHQEEVLARVKTHITIQDLKKDLQSKNRELQRSLERERKIADDLRLNLSISLPHELRTPLNSILGFSSLLKDPLYIPKPDKIAEYGEAIHQGGLRLKRLVENSLLYANLKLLKYTPRTRMFDQYDVFVDTKPFITSVALLKAEDAQRQDDLVLSLTDSHMRVSPQNIKKIIIELLDNAFKFSNPGSQVEIKSIINGTLCILSITDQGRGMTKEQIANIGAYMQFDRDFHEQQGAGLGMIVTSLLTQLEGGVISIDSTPGRGTSVSIVFNCNNGAYETQDTKSIKWFDPDDKHGCKIKGYKTLNLLDREEFTIFVINNDKENFSTITQLLTPAGFMVIEAKDFTQALEKALINPPDLIFTCLTALENQGIDKFGQMKMFSGNEKIKLIVMSTNIMESSNQEHILFMCDDQIMKPAKKKDILDKLEQHLGLEWIYEQ
ncbi:Signal transduction response regulator/histidine kinase [Desulfonema limicola]|uniref:histidine kinase n=1 Tax=Desulfonema limicola TaxID=45656 RepID=A0A975GHX1_9BACT|nr:response regulator [Desulfonema limicola]QTA82005.1 Signal transduction response regulator/histidine kinase [Desulfonema limicola]